jgi:hypothetical protein
VAAMFQRHFAAHESYDIEQHIIAVEARPLDSTL